MHQRTSGTLVRASKSYAKAGTRTRSMTRPSVTLSGCHTAHRIWRFASERLPMQVLGRLEGASESALAFRRSDGLDFDVEGEFAFCGGKGASADESAGSMHDRLA